MGSADISNRASIVVVVTGMLWGLYWLPVRELERMGLPEAWGTCAIVAFAALALSPWAWRDRVDLSRAPLALIGAVALGGAAFALYSIAFTHGRVAVVILLFFLTPVWSTLIARVVLGWPVTPKRAATLVVGLLGLGCVLGAGGQVPVPRSLGEWMGLISGLLWSISTTVIRTRAPLPMAGSAFVFASGALVGALVLALFLSPLPPVPASSVLALAMGTGVLWWGLSMVALMWAAARLEPARTGILLMAEVVLGTVSAALIAGEYIGPLEMVGGALVLAAGVLEVTPERRSSPRA